MVTKKRKKGTTFIEVTRRKQIIEAVVQTIADRGYNSTSLTDIAERIDVTRGVISYHFNGRDDVISVTLQAILEKLRTYRMERVEAATTAMDRLIAFVEANLDFIHNFPDYVITLIELWGDFTNGDVKVLFNTGLYAPTNAYLEQILEQGQQSGQFPEFDLHTMSSLIQAVIDGVMMQWVFDPQSVDLEMSKKEIISLFRHRLLRS